MFLITRVCLSYFRISQFEKKGWQRSGFSIWVSIKKAVVRPEIQCKNIKHEVEVAGWPDPSQFEFPADLLWPYYFCGKMQC